MISKKLGCTAGAGGSRQVQTETATTRLIDLITVVTLLGTDVDLAKSAVSFCNVLQCVGLTSNNIT